MDKGQLRRNVKNEPYKKYLPVRVINDHKEEEPLLFLKNTHLNVYIYTIVIFFFKEANGWLLFSILK